MEQHARGVPIWFRLGALSLAGPSASRSFPSRFCLVCRRRVRRHLTAWAAASEFVGRSLVLCRQQAPVTLVERMRADACGQFCAVVISYGDLFMVWILVVSMDLAATFRTVRFQFTFAPVQAALVTSKACKAPSLPAAATACACTSLAQHSLGLHWRRDPLLLQESVTHRGSKIEPHHGILFKQS